MRASLAAWVFAAPALLVLAVFFGLPVAAAALLSLTDFDLYALADPAHLRLVALDNYLALLRTPLFWKALGNTTYFVVVGVPLSIAVSLGAALLLNSPLARMRGLLRTALFAPVVTTLVAVAVMLLAARPLGQFIDNNPTIKMLALAFILLIGAYLIAEGLDAHIPRGYIYGAMGFSAMVELLNLWVKRNARRRGAKPTTGVDVPL